MVWEASNQIGKILAVQSSQSANVFFYPKGFGEQCVSCQSLVLYSSYIASWLANYCEVRDGLILSAKLLK